MDPRIAEELNELHRGLHSISGETSSPSYTGGEAETLENVISKYKELEKKYEPMVENLEKGIEKAVQKAMEMYEKHKEAQYRRFLEKQGIPVVKPKKPNVLEAAGVEVM